MRRARAVRAGGRWHTITLVPDLAASINDAIDDGLGPLVEVDDPCPF
ncbi:MAG TPA: hypothetical protein VFX65_09985 [Candidatus Limnocylindrales bacterium]|nr:hypothetical protein [Candidatus Limnocylindrales bacterium]